MRLLLPLLALLSISAGIPPVKVNLLGTWKYRCPPSGALFYLTIKADGRYEDNSAGSSNTFRGHWYYRDNKLMLSHKTYLLHGVSTNNRLEASYSMSGIPKVYRVQLLREDQP